MGGVKACRKSFVFFWERKSCRIRPVFGLFWQSEGLEICSTLPNPQPEGRQEERLLAAGMGAFQADGWTLPAKRATFGSDSQGRIHGKPNP